ncbi:EAL domain-containing protein [Klebsiella pneumoniae subsp. pneumoniae]|nr:EAL domain-containing protein [Klebsiella pneumoniae subsp. pneumoniae]
MDQWVIEHAAGLCGRQPAGAAWSAAGDQSFSGVAEPQPEFLRRLRALLQAYNIEPWQIIFELTENYALSNPELVCQTLEHLRALGCRVAIDDFGTGYASYARPLRTMNIDAFLKSTAVLFAICLPAVSSITGSWDSICRLARRRRTCRWWREYVESPEMTSGGHHAGDRLYAGL